METVLQRTGRTSQENWKALLFLPEIGTVFPLRPLLMEGNNWDSGGRIWNHASSPTNMHEALTQRNLDLFTPGFLHCMMKIKYAEDICVCQRSIRKATVILDSTVCFF